MGRRALFIFTENQYNVVSEMMEQAAAYMETHTDYEVCRCKIGEAASIRKEEAWTFVFSAQGNEFEFLKQGDGNVHVTWLVDHPRYLLPRFLDFTDKENLVIGCVDRTHVTYLKQYYGLGQVGFLPHFGWQAKMRVPYAERGIDVFFPSSYTYWEEEVKVRYEGLSGPLKIITDKTISWLLKNDSYSLEDGVTAVLRDFGETDTMDLVRECMEFAGEYVDLYIRAYLRDGIIRALLNAGITLTVCGKNWERVKQEFLHGEKIKVLSENMPYAEVVEKIADSRMVLNMMPWFKDGGHERIAMAALNGAVSLTDESRFINQLFEEEQGAVIYDRKQPEQLAQKINWLLEHPNEAERIAAAGQRIAKEHLGAANFVEQLLKLVHNR